MTQPRIAVKIKGTEDFVAWQKAVGIFKVLVITKFSKFLQRPNSIFCRSANRFSFFVGVYYVVREVVKEGCDV